MKQPVNFDDYVDNYNNILDNQHRFFQPDGSVYFADYKIKLLRDLLKIKPNIILDYGCGIGRSIEYFKKYFPNAHLYGCDISKYSIEYAKNIYPFANLYLIDEMDENMKFDLIFLAGVIHHIPLEKERINTLFLINKLISENGDIVIFEHNPYNPITRYMVNTCPFDEDAILIKKHSLISLLENNGFKIINSGYTLFFPSSLSKLRYLEKYLTNVPFGGQYFIHAKKI